MQFLKPFGGITAANYQTAIDPTSGRYLLNSAEQEKYDSYFEPNTTSSITVKQVLIYAAIAAAAYFIIKKGM